MAVRQVISRGYARWATKVEVDENNTVTVTYDVRQLARNSGGSPIRTDGSTDGGGGTDGTNAEIVPDGYPGWLLVGAGQSSATRQRLVDDFDETYNDGRVITAETEDGDGNLNSAVPLYQDPADQDGEDDNDANDDSDPDDPDPILVFARAGDNQALRRILNNDALDTYIDRGSYYDAQGSDSMRRDLDPDDFVPSVMDHDDEGADVQVVDEAVSTDVGNDVLNITHVLADDNQFLTDSRDDTVDGDDNEIPELVYTYDDDDIFIDSTDDSEAQEIDLDTFEALIDDEDNPVDIQVIAYDVDGTSIFRVHSE